MSPSLNADTLRQIREARKLDASVVSGHINVSEKRFAEFEAGERVPTDRQLANLADAYRVPDYFFFSAELPPMEPLPVDFRTIEQQPAKVSIAGLRALEKSRQRGKAVQTLQWLLDASRDSLPFGARNIDVKTESAAELRERFDVWFSARIPKFKSAPHLQPDILLAIRIFIEAHGIVVNFGEADPSDFLGAFLKPESSAPLIFINRKILSRKAQAFTLMHEFSHYQRDKTGVSNPFQNSLQLERDCNKFAVDFLAPLKEITSIVSEASKNTRSAARDLIFFVSERSLLSVHATAIRLSDLDFISRSAANQFLSTWRTGAQEEKIKSREEVSSPARHGHLRFVSEIGYLALSTAAKAVEEQVVDKIHIRDALFLPESLIDQSLSLGSRRFKVAF